MCDDDLTAPGAGAPEERVLNRDEGLLCGKARRACLGILIIAVVVVVLPKLVSLLLGGGTWHWSWDREAVVCVLMVGLPFLLARIAPGAAGFNKQWLPTARSHWIWFLAMVLLLVVGGAIATSWSGWPRSQGDSPWKIVSPMSVVIGGVVMVLVGPMAEEIFWRGFVLDRLSRLVISGVALAIQACLFALSHIGWLCQGFVYLPALLWYGIVLGAWRLKFRSILPLILAHVILNGIALVPTLKVQYDYAARYWPKPQMRQINALTKEPVEKAIPAIIAFFADPDVDVYSYAVMVLSTRFRADAEPYLKEALASGNTEIVKGAAFTIEMAQMCGLTEDVRKVVWSHKDQACQIAATLTLSTLEDIDGLRKISRMHPNEKVRRTATFILKDEEEAEGKGTDEKGGPGAKKRMTTTTNE